MKNQMPEEAKQERYEEIRNGILTLKQRPLNEGLGLIADAIAHSVCDGLSGTFEPSPELRRQLLIVMAHTQALVTSHAAAFLRGRAQFEAAHLLETEFKP
jgi:hypothetical protein